MKPLRFLLLFVFSVLLIDGHAQLHISKRKHLKGYHIDAVGKSPKSKEFRIREGERTTVAEKEEINVGEPQTVIRPLVTSAALEFATPAPPQTAAAANTTITTKPFGKPSAKPGMLRKGAGLVLNHSIGKAEKIAAKVVPPADESGRMVYATIGFILASLALIALAAGVPIFGLLAIPGLILSILGVKSELKALAICGIVISGIALVIGLLWLLIYALLSGIE